MSTNYPSTSTDITPKPERGKDGRFLTRPANGAPPITSASAGDMARKRWEAYRRGAAKGVLKEAQAIDPDVQTPVDAYALVVGKQYIALMDSDKPRFDDVHRLGQIIGALPGDMDKQQAQPQTIQHVHSLDAGQAAQIAALLADMSGQSGQLIGIISNDDIVDAQAQDIAQDTDAHTQHTLEAGTGADDAAE